MRLFYLTAALVVLTILAAPARAQSLFNDIRALQAEPINGEIELVWDNRRRNSPTEQNQFYRVIIPDLSHVALDQDKPCGGVTSRHPPNFRFDMKEVSGGASFAELFFFAQSANILAIVVRAPSGDVFCNIDAGQFSGFQPGVHLDNKAPAGVYDVWLIPIAPLIDAGGAILGVSTHDFPWEPRGGAAKIHSAPLITAERGPDTDPSRIDFNRPFRLSAGGRIALEKRLPNCPGFINMPQPDFALRTDRGGDLVGLSVEGTFPFVLYVEDARGGANCLTSKRRGQKHELQYPDSG